MHPYRRSKDLGTVVVEINSVKTAPMDEYSKNSQGEVVTENGREMDTGMRVQKVFLNAEYRPQN